MSGETALRAAAKQMAERLKVWQKLHSYHVEVQDSEVTLQVQDLFNASDRAALDAYENALNEINGACPLPMEMTP